MVIDRMVMVTIDDIVRLLRDYCGTEDIPERSRATSFRFNQSDKQLEIMIESPDIPTSEGDRVIQARFDLRQTYGVTS